MSRASRPGLGSLVWPEVVSNLLGGHEHEMLTFQVVEVVVLVKVEPSRGATPGLSVVPHRDEQVPARLCSDRDLDC
jgi:hypothetical protein